MFTATGSMTSAQRASSATLLPNGKVFVAADGDHAELYDPGTGTFARTGSYADTNSSWDAATLLLDGRVLLTGGAAELFDPQSGTFSLTGQMQMHETVITATLLKNGTVLFLESEGDYPAEGVEIYDPATGTFSHIASLYNQGDSFSAAVRRDDGTVLIAGGQLPGGNGIPVAQLYLPATGTFASAGTTEDPHWSGLITLLKQPPRGPRGWED